MIWAAYAHGTNGCADLPREEEMEVRQACPQCNTLGIVVIDGQEIPCGNCDNGYVSYTIREPDPPGENR